MRPPLAIVGTGAVARTLGFALHRAGATVCAVAGRDPGRAASAAAAIGRGVRSARISDIPRLASYVLVATADSRIPEAARELADAGLERGVALHTCGARGPEALSPLIKAGVACAVFHPLQSITAVAAPVSFEGVAFAVAGQPAAVEWAAELAVALKAEVIHPRGDRMSAYHAGAVLASNGVAALLDASLTLMGESGLDRDEARRALGPLMRTALDNALALGPEKSVTGPVVRGDVRTVRLHIEALEGGANLPLPLYRAISLQLTELARRRGLTADTLDALRLAIEARSHPSEEDV